MAQLPTSSTTNSFCNATTNWIVLSHPNMFPYVPHTVIPAFRANHPSYWLHWRSTSKWLATIHTSYTVITAFRVINIKLPTVTNQLPHATQVVHLQGQLQAPKVSITPHYNRTGLHLSSSETLIGNSSPRLPPPPPPPPKWRTLPLSALCVRVQ